MLEEYIDGIENGFYQLDELKIDRLELIKNGNYDEEEMETINKMIKSLKSALKRNYQRLGKTLEKVWD